MTSDPNENDRTVIRPLEPQPPAPPAGRTELMPSTEMIDITEGDPLPAPPPVAPPPAKDDDDEMGSGLPKATRLGEFEIRRLLGIGGFGIVYLAWDHSLEREVALKEYMPTSLAERTTGSQVQVKSKRYAETFDLGLKSFLKEAKMLASFDHPSLVKVYRFWEANGTAYMVMPLLQGKTLKDVLREMRPERPDEAWLLGVLGPLTEALMVIHSRNVSHRDIAPDNIMRLEGGRWLLLDFGAARKVAVDDKTQNLTVILKPGFAPVEQYAEIPGMKQGPWTDVYALAAVVYNAITGRTPPPSVGRLLNDTYEPLASVAEGRYGARFLAAIDRALAVRPEVRTQSIGELRSDLGLGDVVVDPYATQPVPQGTEIPAHARQILAVPHAAAPPAAAPTLQATTAGPRPTASAAALKATAGNGGSGKMIAVGAVVLGALAVGGYLFLAPSPKPAPPPVQAAAPAPAPTAAPAEVNPAPAVVQAPAAPTTPPVFDASLELSRVVQAQTPGFGVQLLTNKTSYRIGRDQLSFTVQSAREGYVYVFIFGADKVLVQLYPHSNGKPLKVREGQTLKLPLAGEAPFDTTPPAGPTDLLVMVSPQLRDHGALRSVQEGPVRIFPTDAEAAAQLARAAGSLPAMAGRAICPAGAPCADEYGAALVKLEVVP